MGELAIHWLFVVNANVFDAPTWNASTVFVTPLNIMMLYVNVPVPPLSYAAIVFDWPASSDSGDVGVMVGVESALYTVIAELLTEFAVLDTCEPVSVTMTFA